MVPIVVVPRLPEQLVVHSLVVEVVEDGKMQERQVDREADTSLGVA